LRVFLPLPTSLNVAFVAMAAFCDNNRQYPAFFGAQEALDENEITFNHVDWPSVPGGKSFQLSFESISLKSYIIL
jgi:hypothetical protein